MKLDRFVLPFGHSRLVRSGKETDMSASGHNETSMKTTKSLLGILVITLGLTAQVQAQTFLTNGLVLYYPFNGNARDASGNWNDGTVEGATLTADRLGHANSAYYFNGTNSDILVPETIFGATNAAWTVSMWITFDSGPYEAFMDVFSKSCVNGEMGIVTKTNGVVVEIHTPSEDWIGASAQLLTNSTMHVVGVYQKGQSLSLYIDGVLRSSIPVPNDDLWAQALPVSSALGVYHYALGPYDRFRGTLDEFRVYTRALSASEVQQLYQYESAPGCVSPPAGLVGWWRLENNGGDDTLLNPGVVVGNPGFVPGEVGLAMNSPGARAGVVVSNSASLNFGPGADFCIEAWIRPVVASTSSGIMDIVDKRVTNPDLVHALGYVLSLADGRLAFQMCDSLSRTPLNVGPTGPDLRDGAWHHIAATIRRGAADGGTLYIDGVPALTFDPTGYAGSLATSEPLLIGLIPIYSIIDCDFRGGIDEVSVYARALSSAEVQAIHRAGSAGKCKLPVTQEPRPATATAAVVNGFVVGATITDGGFGYTNTPPVRIIGGGGSGAQALTVVSNGVVIAVNMLAAGSGYTSTPLLVIDPPFIPNPVLNIAPASFLTFSNLTLGGVYQLQQLVAWYWSNQPVTFTATNPLFTQVVMGLAGSGDYRLALSPAPGQAFATAQVVNGFVVGATVTSGGSGYVTAPAVTIVGGGGTNATAASHISGGVVTSITITDAGLGYANAPSVRIAPPPVAAVFPTVLPAMRVDSASLAPYNDYQIQFKQDLGATWTHWGLFSPTDVTNSQYILITNGVGFFRLQYAP